jgi:DNA polymerase V
MSWHPAQEIFNEALTLDEYLIPKKEAAYILRIRGNAMKELGIIDGDMAVVERSAEARPQDIVVMEADGGYVIHPFDSEHRSRILAVVRAVIRKY